jgi:hypothetical protein
MPPEVANDPTRNLKTERLNDIAYGYKQAGTLLAALFGNFLLYSAKEAYDRWKDLAQTIRGSGGPMTRDAP